MSTLLVHRLEGCFSRHGAILFRDCGLAVSRAVWTPWWPASVRSDGESLAVMA